jgi:hypothetical protein
MNGDLACCENLKRDSPDSPTLIGNCWEPLTIGYRALARFIAVSSFSADMVRWGAARGCQVNGGSGVQV